MISTSTTRARKKMKKETKTNKRQCPPNSVQVQDPWRQTGRNKNDYGLVWRKGFVKEMSFKSGVKDCGSDVWWDVVTVIRWYAQDEVNQDREEWTEWGWRNEEGSWFHRYGDAYEKERLVLCNEEDTENGRPRVTVDEERVLYVEWPEMIV